MNQETPEQRAQREQFDALVSIEESCKQGIFAFLTHWLMNTSDQNEVFDWLDQCIKDMKETISQTKDNN